MEETQNLEAIMGLIMHGGDAKGKAVEAIRAAKVFDFETAEKNIKEANEALNIAHRSQTNLLSQEAAGKSIEVSLLMVHGQDHLMTALTFIDMAKEVIDLYRTIEQIKPGV
ncbi:PTS lactose/cellobiose transporter subunit IIA [Ignavigranum ruoffiae]|uniref:PTS lactose/cellobiose transporter subunit IIA n=1 Tax=Ignavigranum ruoffiae TaxID=89093 RepID=UPI00204ECDAC|nr:PTS lactose/cellobiose transporter subunit IIA [Ignavigranum ruoffiae]UPQ86088.1 PTS lactose/cellobiose transporter subunit IIA [Ignavigranum ruoffiae]